MTDDVTPYTAEALLLAIKEYDAQGFDPRYSDGLGWVKMRAAELTRAMPATQGWRPIASAPKDGTYILIAECGALPDIAEWCRELPERVDSHGTKYLARPEGWFDVSRSRLHPTHWQPLPEPPHED